MVDMIEFTLFVLLPIVGATVLLLIYKEASPKGVSRFPFWIPVLACFLGIAVWMISEMEHFTVQVVDTEGHPMPHVEVDYTSGEYSLYEEKKGSVSTDSSGKAVIPKIKSTRTHLLVEAEGMIRMEVDVERWRRTKSEKEWHVTYSWKRGFSPIDPFIQECMGFSSNGVVTIVLQPEGSLRSLPYMAWLKGRVGDGHFCSACIESLAYMDQLNEAKIDEASFSASWHSTLRGWSEQLEWLHEALEAAFPEPPGKPLSNEQKQLLAALTEWASGSSMSGADDAVKAQTVRTAIEAKRDAILNRIRPFFMSDETADTTCGIAARFREFPGPLLEWSPRLLGETQDRAHDRALSLCDSFYLNPEDARKLLWSGNSGEIDLALSLIKKGNETLFQPTHDLLVEFISKTQDSKLKEEAETALQALNDSHRRDRNR